jgi:hypothetical protein
MSTDNPVSVTGSTICVGGGASMQATGRTRTNLSVPHLLSACLFSRSVSQLEAAHRGKAFGPFWEEILAHATASLLLTVASLESYVNELFADVGRYFPSIPSAILQKIWETHEQKPILEKFDLALLLRNVPLVDRGSRPGQDVVLLIRLRNAVVHFKPEWFDSQEDHAKLSNQLKGCFPGSPFFGPDEPLFPRGWATHDCTAWAVNSAVAFIDVIDQKAGLPSHLDQFRSRFTP